MKKKIGLTMALLILTLASPFASPVFGANPGATPGWDMVTGLGSVNAYNLVFNSAW